MSSTAVAPIRWSSRLAFIIAAAGAAIGLGNLWKFPYLAGENGGGAFVLIYLGCVAVAGLPIMMAETLLGRLGRGNPVEAMRRLAAELGLSAGWRGLGWLGILAGLGILSYYSVIAGWGMAYLFKMGGGFLHPEDAQASHAVFNELKTSLDVQIIWHTAFLALTSLIVGRGLSAGIESVTRLMIPGLLLMLFLLVGYGATTPGFGKSLSFLFVADFSKVDGRTLLIALGQAFFSLGLANGSTMVYGAYLPDHVSIARTSLWVALADTLAALLAGVAIFSIVFANGMEPGMGPGLIFETLPLAFAKMPFGTLFGTIFFILVFFAAITSAIALMEPAVSLLSETFGFERHSASLTAAAVSWMLGLGTIGAFQHETAGASNFYTLIDGLTADLMLPVGGLLIIIFAAWILPASASELGLEAGRWYPYWRIIGRYIAPIAVLIILIQSLQHLL